MLKHLRYYISMYLKPLVRVFAAFDGRDISVYFCSSPTSGEGLANALTTSFVPADHRRHYERLYLCQPRSIFHRTKPTIQPQNAAVVRDTCVACEERDNSRRRRERRNTGRSFETVTTCLPRAILRHGFPKVETCCAKFYCALPA